jgi:hypothetical protein
LEVDRGIIDDGVLVFYHLEEGARAAGRAAECARSLRDNVDVFRTLPNRRRGPIEGIMSNVAVGIDCVDLTVGLVGHQDLTAEGSEA